MEITETVPLIAGGVEMANLDALRAMGVRIAIDDFGAGHASLQYLRGFAFDIIKIDRTYVANLTDSRIDAMIVSAICDIARSLPVEVIAEGIETHEQLAKLKLAGCTGLQGFLLGRPAAAAPDRQSQDRQRRLTPHRLANIQHHHRQTLAHGGVAFGRGCAPGWHDGYKGWSNLPGHFKRSWLWN